MKNHNIGGIDVLVQLGPYDDSGLDLVVKAEKIPMGVPSLEVNAEGTMGGFGISIKEASNAKAVRYWPSISLHDSDRRKIIYSTARNALNDAESSKAVNVGFFTLALEVSRIPSWEVAEEITKAVHSHSKQRSFVERVFIVASSPIQVSSFQFALDNFGIIKSD